MYWNIEKKCKIFTKRMSIYVPLNQIMLIGPLLSTFYCVFIGNFDTSTWKLPFDHAVPFNTKNIWKWYLLWIFQFNVGLFYAALISGLTAYFTCFCFYINGIGNHCDMLVASLQSNVDQNRTNPNLQQYRKYSSEIKKELCKVIEIHVKAFE